MKKSTSTPNQHGYNLRSRNTSINKVSGPGRMNKKMKLEDQYQIEEMSPSGVSTIGAVSSMTQEFSSLPPEVLQIILLHLKRKDLLDCRQVNSVWRSITRPILLRSRYSVWFNRYGPDWPTKFITLIKCLTESKRLNCLDQFPCTRFHLQSTNLDDHVVQNFFNLYGPFIKTLSLQWVRVGATEDGQLETLERLLTRQASNIEDLRMYLFTIPSPTKVHDEKIILFNKFPNGINNVKLPALKTLDVTFESNAAATNEITKEILEAADNLESYKLSNDVDESVLDTLVSLKKIHTIEFSYVNLSSRLSFWECLASLFSQNLQCVNLDFESLWGKEDNLNLLERVADFIQKLLESSSNSLETVECRQPLGFLPGFRMPILNQLKELTIRNEIGFDNDEWIPENVFPRGLSLSTTFPNVKKVNLDLGLYDDYNPDYWTTFFSHINLMDNTWPSVTLLRMCMPPEAIDNISRLFPNLRHLGVLDVKHFQPMCLEIFQNLKQLESLEFEIVHCNSPRNEYPEIEVAFTGFSYETCLRLAKSDVTLGDVDVENLRENLSLLELTNLKHLKLSGVYNYYEGIFTRVSAVFAFQLMPQLRVSVGLYFDEDDGDKDAADAVLKAMVPFVHSVEFED